MGKPTGFMEIPRELPEDRLPTERVNDWNEFHLHMPEPKLKDQGARCMDCGIPFCHTGTILAGMANLTLLETTSSMPLSSRPLLPYIPPATPRGAAMAINGHRNKPIGPGGSTRRLHHGPPARRPVMGAK